jgi:exocyst complex component 4
LSSYELTVFANSRYQALLKTYEQLSSLILDTIRIEVRCRTMYYIDSAMRHVETLLSMSNFSDLFFWQGNYTLEGEAGEPDFYIMDLNRELAQCDEFLEKSLPEKQRRYVDYM